MKVIESEEYEELAAAFQCVQISILDDALKQHGINEDVRRSINKIFTLNFGLHLDQQWFETSRGETYPLVIFSEKHWKKDPLELIVNDGSFSWYEYASGNVDGVYEEIKSDTSPKKIGLAK